MLDGEGNPVEEVLSPQEPRSRCAGRVKGLLSSLRLLNSDWLMGAGPGVIGSFSLVSYHI